MAKIIPFGTPVNESERRAIVHLRDNLPDSYVLMHNFELLIGNQAFEIDLAVIAPHALYLVDVKGIKGEINVFSGKWYLPGRPPYASPLAKLRQHAKIVKSLLVGSPERVEMKQVFVDAIVILTEEGAYLTDPSGVDSTSVTTISKSISFLQDTKRLPFNNRPVPNLLSIQGRIINTLQGGARVPKVRDIYGDWKIEERLGGTGFYSEYRGYNRFAGPFSGKVNLRLYEADPYLPEAERLHQAQRIATAYNALNAVPSHPAIPGARNFFQDETSGKYVLVTEEVAGKPLRLHLEKISMPLTMDQKIRVVKDVLGALVHLHRYKVCHRAINPGNIILAPEGQSRLTDFDFAKTDLDRSVSVGSKIYEQTADSSYLAPEVFADAHKSAYPADIYSAGMSFYEMYTGEKAFPGLNEAIEANCIFAEAPSTKAGNLPTGFDQWLQDLCTLNPNERPDAQEALKRFEELFETTLSPQSDKEKESPDISIDYSNLPSGFQLTHTYVVERRLGTPGTFGVAYKVIDTLGDVPRVIKIIIRDRTSPVDRLKQEYQHLLRIPQHPNVVKVVHADYLPANGYPYLIFEYVDGVDVSDMIRNRTLSLNDAKELALQVGEGLRHLHTNGIAHCDIKPNNLLWTEQGAKIIDFNVSMSAVNPEGRGGGSRKYIPPDSNFDYEETMEDRQDRDIFALGVTIYQVITGKYPWEESGVPAVGQPALDPRKCDGCEDLSSKLSEVLLKAISPRRVNRYKKIDEFVADLKAVQQLRRQAITSSEPKSTINWGEILGNVLPRPNTNPFVGYLSTLYSQSKRTNIGTRGLDRLGGQLYIETALDKILVPEVLEGKFRLVVISGNAGDGKTAFLQRLEKEAQHRGEQVVPAPGGNGAIFKHKGRRYLSNYDGSQDEGEKVNDAVLLEFLGPFQGTSDSVWPDNETRLIAVNQGRLIDFLEHHSSKFVLLKEIVQNGLLTCKPDRGIVAVNLNLRSIVATRKESAHTIFDTLLRRFTNQKFWDACSGCDLKDKCFVLHNVQTFQDSTSGNQVQARLRILYFLTFLRGKLHITIRDLSSALAYTLTTAHDCDQVHQLYASGNRDIIFQSFYFNSWMGGDNFQKDRLLKLLKEIDIGNTNNARIDRLLDFRKPTELSNLMSFDGRNSKYDREVLQSYFSALPNDTTNRAVEERLTKHQYYIHAVRRLHFFECRDESWHNQLPYHSADRFIELIEEKTPLDEAIPRLIGALNRGEGLFDPQRLKGKLAIQVRKIEGGTIRCYRVLPAAGFSLVFKNDGKDSPYIESMPSGLVLKFNDDKDQSQIQAEMNINLDVFEMLERLNQGYKPSVEEIQGFWLSLNVFKNVLSSAPYQEILLTSSGHTFYSVERQTKGKLVMTLAEPGIDYAASKKG